MVVGGSLSYSCYQNSGIANQVSLGPTGEDLNHSFASQTTGAVYAGLLVNVSAAQTAGDYFFHLNNLPTGTINAGRVFVQKDPAGPNYAFGIRYAAAGTIAYTPFVYAPGSVHLLVLKYTFNPGANDDVTSLYIDPALGAAEPAPNVSFTDTVRTRTQISAVNFRQARRPTRRPRPSTVSSSARRGPTSRRRRASRSPRPPEPAARSRPRARRSCRLRWSQALLDHGEWRLRDQRRDRGRRVAGCDLQLHVQQRADQPHHRRAVPAGGLELHDHLERRNGRLDQTRTARRPCAAGGDQAYAIAADDCYTIADVTVDGVSQGPVSATRSERAGRPHDRRLVRDGGGLHDRRERGSRRADRSERPDSGAVRRRPAVQGHADDCFVIADVTVDGASQGQISSYHVHERATRPHDRGDVRDGGAVHDQLIGGTGRHDLAGRLDDRGVRRQPDYSITADGCHTIADVVVDGVSQGPVANYAFTNVHSDHTISASFSTIQYTVIVGANGNGTVTKSPDQATLRLRQQGDAAGDAGCRLAVRRVERRCERQRQPAERDRR
jgi:hypothetical protein